MSALYTLFHHNGTIFSICYKAGFHLKLLRLQYSYRIIWQLSHQYAKQMTSCSRLYTLLNMEFHTCSDESKIEFSQWHQYEMTDKHKNHVHSTFSCQPQSSQNCLGNVVFDLKLKTVTRCFKDGVEWFFLFQPNLYIWIVDDESLSATKNY